MISPKRLKNEDKEAVLNSLIKFYNLRPDEYGLMERSQKVYEEYVDFIKATLKDKNLKILDFGTGSWRIVEQFAKIGFTNTLGLDYFSDEKLTDYSNKLSETSAKLISYIEADKIPLEDESVDCVSSLCVVEHLVYIEKNFLEMDRVLKKGGHIVILSPNWSGINIPIHAMKQNLIKKDRLWLYDSFLSSFLGFFRTIKWYLEALFTNDFILIYPRMKGTEIDFERSDDDALHLCQPISIRKFFKKLGYETLVYNRGYGTTKYSKLFNNLFPSMATTNTLVFKKK